MSLYSRFNNVLIKVTQALHKSSNLEEIYGVALDAVTELENVDMVMIYLVDEERHEAVLKAHKSVPEDYIRKAGRIPYPKGVTWNAIETGGILNIEDIQKDPNIGPAGRDLGHHSVLGIPILLEEKVIGVIWFLSYRERKFDEREVNVLSTLGDQIAIAIARAKMFEEMRRREEALRQSEEQYRNLFENVPTGVYRTTPDGRIIMANPALIRMLGYSSFEELASRNLEEEGFDANYPRSQFKKLIERRGEISGLESAWLRRDGSLVFVRESARAVRGEGGTVLYYEGTVEDITDRKRAEEALRESEERYRTLVEHTYDLIAETSVDGRFLYVSSKHKSVLGYGPGELLGGDIFEHVHPDDRPSATSEFQKATATRSSGHAVFRFRHRNGDWRWLESTGKPFRTSGGELRGVIASRDITERRRAEEQIKESLKEKEVLLKEIHHRVKNNLQVISSLINLQSQYTKSKRTLEMFNETRNRIRSMALIHEQLYRSRNLAVINFGEYARGLLNNLLYSYETGPDTVQLNVEVESVFLNIDAAIPCGLILNELVSNSLKHAFPDGKKGEIRIGLHSNNGGTGLPVRPRFTLVVGDSGVGFPKGLDFRNTKSLGLQLVADLVEQLGGCVEVCREGGTEFKITFEV